MALVFIIALLVFGPKKLPEIGRELGKAIREFKKASRDVVESFQEAMDEREHRLPTYNSYNPPNYPEYEYRPEPAVAAQPDDQRNSDAAHPPDTAPSGTVSRSQGEFIQLEPELPRHTEPASAEVASAAGQPTEPAQSPTNSPERIS
jgi:sec-independent protein translocase protein TatA